MDINQLPPWLEAVGTIGAVVVALFQNSIRNWCNRPKIVIAYEHESPFFEKIKEDTESSDVDQRAIIRVRVTNEGKYTANYSVLNIDSYFVKREKEDTYVEKNFTPIQLKDYKGSTPNTIAPHLKYYFDVATIIKQDDFIDADSNGNRKQFFKLFLLGERKPTLLGKGTFIIPIKFYSSKAKTVTSYMKIYWDSDDFLFDKSHFDIEMLSEKEYQKLKKVK